MPPFNNNLLNLVPLLQNGGGLNGLPEQAAPESLRGQLPYRPGLQNRIGNLQELLNSGRQFGPRREQILNNRLGRLTGQLTGPGGFGVNLPTIQPPAAVFGGFRGF